MDWAGQQPYPQYRRHSLVEKAIRALSLLESLVRSGCPFILKGGTALMLHLDTSRRLSIDVDIVCPPGTEIRDYLGQYGSEYGFIEAQEIEHNSRTGVPKSHAEYRYAVPSLTGLMNWLRSGKPTARGIIDIFGW